MQEIMLDSSKEKKIEFFLRNNSWILYSVTILTVSILYFAIYFCLILFNQGYYFIVFPAGLFAHAFFVITMHDGLHKSLTKTKLDYFIMNLSSGLLVLPFYAEFFKKYHLLHHVHTNTELDPLYSKKEFFDKHRKLYVLLQLIPFAFNISMLFMYGFKKKMRRVNAPTINKYYLFFSLLVAITVVVTIKPSLWFILGTFGVMTIVGTIRFWAEHMGVKENSESNTHWFPLGMGIGNHEVHHEYPNFSWLTLAIGMFFRKKDTNPIKTIRGILFDNSFHYYLPKKKS